MVPYPPRSQQVLGTYTGAHGSSLVRGDTTYCSPGVSLSGNHSVLHLREVKNWENCPSQFPSEGADLEPCALCVIRARMGGLKRPSQSLLIKYSALSSPRLPFSCMGAALVGCNVACGGFMVSELPVDCFMVAGTGCS